ncbi:phosphotransferase [Paenibacillus sp. 19GGS1-52]|uniref:aminoglycoside phosphotransferase family protein n=1 Tax=Paenibacillus sp. 19GGS1-52 TaxID=2758563 RepID=UPI001EFA84A2|nr:phosphotransferase [Paenibacillus sp. 19GGS1-52]ULO06838.1 phosphotransferase [Paenibacillus sp. 19GGS1-52]
MDAITGIPNSEAWTRIEPVLKGWSSDKKYYVEAGEGQKLLLRLSSREAFERKQAEYELIERVNQLDFPMSRVIDFGVCNDGQNTYMLLTWVEGHPLEERILLLSEAEQYQLGVQSAKAQKKIHSIPNLNNLSNWEANMQAKILARVKNYENGPYRVEGDETALTFIRGNIGLLSNVEKVYQHGDFHIGNLIYTPQDQIGVIDFNRCDSGDYVEEFYKLQAFDRERSIPFARGRIHGYFEGEPPKEFWARMALYVAYSSLFSIVWAIPYGAVDIEGMRERCKVALADYDGFKRVIPDWYV